MSVYGIFLELKISPKFVIPFVAILLILRYGKAILQIYIGYKLYRIISNFF